MLRMAPVEKLGSQFLIRLLVFQQVIPAHQEGMGHRHNGALLALTRGEVVKAGCVEKSPWCAPPPRPPDPGCAAATHCLCAVCQTNACRHSRGSPDRSRPNWRSGARKETVPGSRRARRSGGRRSPLRPPGWWLSGVGVLSCQKHLGILSQCVRLIRLRPRLWDEAASRERALIEQRHQDSDPALAEDTDQA